MYLPYLKNHYIHFNFMGKHNEEAQQFCIQVQGLYWLFRIFCGELFVCALAVCTKCAQRNYKLGQR